VNGVFALEFPEISEVLVWPSFPGLDAIAFNKIAFICVLAVILTALLFLIAGGRDASVAPKGVRNFAEAIVDFIQDGIVMQTMGRDGLGWTPFLTSLFCFIFLCNITEVLPTFQMPATARMAIPAFLALLVWVIFIVVGVKHQGGLGYLKSSLFPPGVPKPLYVLVTPIELISTFLVRPFSLAVRLFANMLAGHILLVTFSVLTAALVGAEDKVLIPLGVLPFVMLVFLTGFEILVALLQAYIFAILAAVYIGGSMHPEH
jgi:F-type H+-transporting ATPase subunit a